MCYFCCGGFWRVVFVAGSCVCVCVCVCVRFIAGILRVIFVAGSFGV